MLNESIKIKQVFLKRSWFRVGFPFCLIQLIAVTFKRPFTQKRLFFNIPDFMIEYHEPYSIL